MPEHLRAEWLCYRLVAARVATLQEIDTHYSMHDVLDMIEVLDLHSQAEQMANDAANARSRKGGR